MAIASGASVGLSYVAEVTRGTTPGGPTMLELRSTSRNINATRRPLQSAERRSNRQIQDFRHGFKEVTGGIGFESGRTSLRAAVFERLTGIRQAQARVLESGISDLQGSLLIFSRGETVQSALKAFDAGFAELQRPHVPK